MNSIKRVNDADPKGEGVFYSVNPYNSEVIGQYRIHSPDEIEIKLNRLQTIWKTWKNVDYTARQDFLKNLDGAFAEQSKPLSEMISLEMGKSLVEANAEIQKSRSLLRYYANLENVFHSQSIRTPDGYLTHIYDEPIGVILGIMPWNYPVWQVLRAAVPAILSGNVFLLKHAPNVSGVAEIIEKIFLQVFEENEVLASVRVVDHDVVRLIEHRSVAGVTFTGSTKTGRLVASSCAYNIKPHVLELGGNNAMIIDESADLNPAVKAMIQSRFQNSGQSCLATKRGLIHKNIWDEFMQRLYEELSKLKVGNPLEGAGIGPLARKDLADLLENQIEELGRLGYISLVKPVRQGNIFSPGIFIGDLQLFREEIFGPILLVYKVDSLEKAVEMANDSDFGLGVSVFTKDNGWIEANWGRFMEGSIAHNDFVKSYPEIPFGGIKNSGYGSELGIDGLFSFMHKKTVRVLP